MQPQPASRSEYAAPSPAAEGSDAVTFNISDDGRGADPREPPSGLGLIGMRERVEMLGGRLGVTTAPGLGFSIAASIPVDQRLTATTP